MLKYNKPTPLQKGILTGVVKLHGFTSVKGENKPQKIGDTKYNHNKLKINRRKDIVY